MGELEGNKKKLPIRKQITDIVAEVNSMQEMYQRTESVVLKMEQSYAEIKKSCNSLTKKLEAAMKQLEELPDDASPEMADQIGESVVSIKTSAEKKTNELSKMKAQLEKASKMALEIGKTINQRKQTYDTLKPDYDKQVAQIDAEIAKKKAEVEELEKTVDDVLMKKYKSAKAKLNKPPLFELTGSSCKCCNMSLTGGGKKNTSNGLFGECENCGALLYTTK